MQWGGINFEGLIDENKKKPLGTIIKGAKLRQDRLGQLFARDFTIFSQQRIAKLSDIAGSSSLHSLCRRSKRVVRISGRNRFHSMTARFSRFHPGKARLFFILSWALR